jgi:hypothetical protein
MMSKRCLHSNTHVGFLMIAFSRIKDIQLLGLNHYACVTYRKLVLCISYKMKYLQNEARKQKSIKEVTLQFSMIFQIRLKNNTVNFRVICPLDCIHKKSPSLFIRGGTILLSEFLGS